MAIAHGSLLVGIETSIFWLPALSSNHNAAESHVKPQTQPLIFITVLRFSHEAQWIHVCHVDMHISDLPANFNRPFIYLVLHCTKLSSLFHFVALSVPSLPGGREQHWHSLQTFSPHTARESCTWTHNWILHVPETGVCWTLFWHCTDRGKTEAWTLGTVTKRGFVFIPVCLPPFTSLPLSYSHSLSLCLKLYLSQTLCTLFATMLYHETQEAGWNVNLMLYLFFKWQSEHYVNNNR